VSKVRPLGKTEVRALSDVDLAIGAGEFVAVAGPSGCGKSVFKPQTESLDLTLPTQRTKFSAAVALGLAF
jgi:ABC-type lipoprotein export system ATPase subunit